MSRLQNIIANKKVLFQPKNLLLSYLIAFGLGVLIGFKIIPVNALAVLYLLVVGICAILFLRGDVENIFKWLPYVMYLEVYMRAFARWVPYLTIQYLYIFGFGILFLKGSRMKGNHFKGFLLLLAFSFLELVNNLHPYDPANTRAVLVNSLSLLLPVMWASYNDFKPVLINKFLSNIKIAGVLLSGIVFVAHVTGSIDYGLFSNSEASNGLAPVQLSGYLGFVCIIFFLSIMNVEEKENKTVNLIIFSTVLIMMVLTFSRGGVYFLLAVVLLYIYYNKNKMGNYFKLVGLIPVFYILYTVVVDKTGGKIVERYEQEGTSNRDVLVDIGFQLFWKNPIFGVGTGNYNIAIMKEHLFSQNSGAHNEFVRAAAEHGIIGIFFYWTFFLMLFLNINRRPQPQKQYAMYFLALFTLIIIHNGLKISIQPLILMLAIGTPGLAYLKNKDVSIRDFRQPVIA